MTKFYKSGSINAAINHTRAVYRSTTAFFSYDKDIARVETKITTVGGVPLKLRAADKIRLTMFLDTKAGLKRHDYLMEKDYVKQICYFVIPEAIRRYEGKAKCGLTIDFEDGRTADAGAFEMMIKRSMVDTELTEIETVYSQEFEELVRRMEMYAAEVIDVTNREIERVKKSVNDKAALAKDNIRKDYEEYLVFSADKRDKISQDAASVAKHAEEKIKEYERRFATIDQSLEAAETQLNKLKQDIANGVYQSASKTDAGIVRIGDGIDVTDEGLISVKEITKTSELTNDSDYIKKTEVAWQGTEAQWNALSDAQKSKYVFGALT